MLSRVIETYSNQTYHYWDYNNRTTLNADNDFVQEIEQAFKKASKKDAFYHNRLWFQVLRAKFYSEDRASVIAFFEQTAKKQPKNSLYYRGLSYVGGAYKSLKNYEKANTAFAQVFDERSEEHTSELQSRPHLVCRLLLEKKKKKNSNKV